MDEKVIDRARGFARFWRRRLGSYPKYRLDFSWPSVAVVDWILFPLRDRALSPQEEEYVLSASAYLSCLVHDCWSNFHDGLKTEVTFEEGGGVTVTAAGGKTLGAGETITLEITKHLLEVLREPKNPFPFYERTERPLAELDNRLSPWMLGLLTGLSPSIQGPWAKQQDAQHEEQISQVNDFLARSTADYFSQVYPGSDNGGDSIAFACNLILPPLFHAEPYPGVRSVGTLLRYLPEERKTEEPLMAFALQLAHLPDEQMATTGFLLGAALAPGDPQPQLLYAAQSRGALLPKLYPSVIISRRLLKRPADWVASLREKNEAETSRLFMSDYKLGLMPLLQFNPLEHSNERFFPTFKAIAMSDVENAKDGLAELTHELGYMNSDLLFQSIFLDLASGDLESADGKLKEVVQSNLAKDFSAAEQAAFYELNAQLRLSQGERSDSEMLLTKALELGLKDDQTFRAASLLLSSLLIERGAVGKVREVVGSLLARDPHCLEGALLRYDLLEGLEQHEEADALLQKLAREAPGHRKVFQAVVAATR